MRRSMIRMLLASLIVLGATARPTVMGSLDQDPLNVDWSARLEALRPESPLGYFELAEEVADQALGDGQIVLANRLFALSAVLDTSRFGRSACLAMADLEPRPHVRRRLLAMASLLASASNRAVLLRPTSRDSLDADAALHVVEAFSYYRRGLGRRAQKSLQKPGAMDLLETLDPLLQNGTQRFLEDCKLYEGKGRPSLSESILARMLRLEQALLSGDDRSWSAELLLKSGAPLIEIDIQRIDSMLDVNADRCVYRDGRWIRPRD